jgi:hypothetical protein
MKLKLTLFVLLLAFAQPASAEIEPIIWSESIHNTQKPPSTLVNIDNHIVIKSDRSISLDLTEHSPIKTIVLRPDNTSKDSHFEKKSFLFTIELSDSAKKVIDIPFGEHKFN